MLEYNHPVSCIRFFEKRLYRDAEGRRSRSAVIEVYFSDSPIRPIEFNRKEAESERFN